MSKFFSSLAELVARRFTPVKPHASLAANPQAKCALTYFTYAIGSVHKGKRVPAFGFSRVGRTVFPALPALFSLLGVTSLAGSVTGCFTSAAFAAEVPHLPNVPTLSAQATRLADMTDRVGPQTLRSLPEIGEVGPEGSVPDAQNLTPLRTKRSGEIVLYVDSRMPEAVLLKLARSAERLGATVAVTGFPVKPRERNPAFRKETLEMSDVLKAEGLLPRDKFELGNAAALVKAGINVSVNPLPWEAIERSLNANRAPEDRVPLPMPALVAICGNALEVLPGAVDPVYGAARLAQRARDRGVRAYLHEHLREKGLSVHLAEP